MLFSLPLNKLVTPFPNEQIQPLHIKCPSLRATFMFRVEVADSVPHSSDKLNLSYNQTWLYQKRTREVMKIARGDANFIAVR